MRLYIFMLCMIFIFISKVLIRKS